MRTKLYIIAILSIAAVAMNAQTFQPATIDNSAIQSQQIMQTGTRYNGQVYEPFSSVTPSEQSAVGAGSSPAKVSGPRRGFDTGAETGRDDEYPIGEPWIMVAFAAVFGGVVYLRRRKARG